MGDNVGVLRTASAFGRSRTDEVWRAIEQPVMHLACQGWDTQRVAVRRQFNRLADRLATRATNSGVQARNTRGPPSIWVWSEPDVPLARPALSGWFSGTAVYTEAGPLWAVSP